jgi:hypothetical protein
MPPTACCSLTMRRSGGHRARTFRRHLCQRRLHSNQGARCKRAGRACRQSRRVLWREDRGLNRLRHAQGQGTQGQDRDALPRQYRSVAAWHERLRDFSRAGPHFTGPKTVEVNGQTLTGDRIFINVGGEKFLAGKCYPLHSQLRTFLGRSAGPGGGQKRTLGHRPAIFEGG